MIVFDTPYLNILTEQAKKSLRLRQHRNIHYDYQDPCQRLFNAIEPGSYIRPHRHLSDPRDELLIAIRGLFLMITFDDQGAILNRALIGSEQNVEEVAVGVQVAANTWHTVIALESGSVLLEVKAGPFDPSQPKDLAPWAPEEGSPLVKGYLKKLLKIAVEDSQNSI